jgi:hypothetical protein
MILLNNNEGRAKTAKAFMIVQFVFSLILLLGSIQLISLLRGVETGNFDYDDLLLKSQILGGLSILFFITYIPTIVFFIMWFRRAYYNLHQFPDAFPDHAEGWAAGAWFVPFLNLVRPFTIMKEIWQGTQRFSKSNNPEQGTTILGLWWVFFLVGNIVENVGSKIAMAGDESIEDIIIGQQFAIAGTLFHIPAYILIIIIINRMAKFEKELYINCNEVDITEHLIDDSKM